MSAIKQTMPPGIASYARTFESWKVVMPNGVRTSVLSIQCGCVVTMSCVLSCVGFLVAVFGFSISKAKERSKKEEIKLCLVTS